MATSSSPLEPDQASLSDEERTLRSLRDAREDIAELVRLTQIPTYPELEEGPGAYDWSRPVGLVLEGDMNASLV